MQGHWRQRAGQARQTDARAAASWVERPGGHSGPFPHGPEGPEGIGQPRLPAFPRNPGSALSDGPSLCPLLSRPVTVTVTAPAAHAQITLGPGRAGWERRTERRRTLGYQASRLRVWKITPQTEVTRLVPSVDFTETSTF